MTQRPCALYRYFDGADELVYVGISNDPGTRLGQHRLDKPWWDDVVTAKIQRYPDRASALAAERIAIRDEHPRYNIVHNGPRRDAGWPAEAMADCCHDGCMPEHMDATIYFPRWWELGVAHYVCIRGHRWTCGWGHKGSGEANLPPLVEPTPRRCPCIWLEAGIGGRLECCDCGVQWNPDR